MAGNVAVVEVEVLDGAFHIAEEALIVAVRSIDGELNGVALAIESATEGVLGSADGDPVIAEVEVISKLDGLPLVIVAAFVDIISDRGEIVYV